MTDIEIEVPLYHPKGCACAICLAAGALLAERDALSAEVERLDQLLALSIKRSHDKEDEITERDAVIERLREALKLVLEVGLADEDGAGQVEKTIYAALAQEGK